MYLPCIFSCSDLLTKTPGWVSAPVRTAGLVASAMEGLGGQAVHPKVSPVASMQHLVLERRVPNPSVLEVFVHKRNKNAAPLTGRSDRRCWVRSATHRKGATRWGLAEGSIGHSHSSTATSPWAGQCPPLICPTLAGRTLGKETSFMKKTVSQDTKTITERQPTGTAPHDPPIVQPG